VTYLLHPVGRYLLTLVNVADIAASADPYVPILEHPGLTLPRHTRLIDEGLGSPEEEVVPEPAPLRLISWACYCHADGEPGEAEVRVGRVVDEQSVNVLHRPVLGGVDERVEVSRATLLLPGE
jgi:hypothetical protein